MDRIIQVFQFSDGTFDCSDSHLREDWYVRSQTAIDAERAAEFVALRLKSHDQASA